MEGCRVRGCVPAEGMTGRGGSSNSWREVRRTRRLDLKPIRLNFSALPRGWLEVERAHYENPYRSVHPSSRFV